MILSQPKSRSLLPDLLRCLACPAVLLFHMQLLPGGYLAVCCFFTLSGYWMAASLLGPETPALGRYYKGRFLRLWLPAAAAVLLTLGISFGLMGHAWPGMKQESLSVLLGFHNFRQIALQDNYFAPHSITPLQPLWYTSILMQFTLVFPPVFLLLRKAKPALRTLLMHGLTLAGLLAFDHFCLKGDLTRLYYHSLSRIFSLLLGASFFCQRQWFETKWPDRTLSKTALLLSALVPLLLLLLLFCLIGSDSPLMPAAMPVASLLTGLALAGGQELQRPLPRLLRPLNAVSYELYLLQGPVLYLLGRCPMSRPLYLPAAALVLCAAAALLWLALRTKQHTGLWARILEVLLCAFCLFGLYCWLTAPDQSREQTQMESQSQQNRQLMRQKQREEALGFKAIAAKANQLARDTRQKAEAGKAAYLDKKEQRSLREAELTRELASIALQKDTLADSVLQLPITAIGDSVMLGASAELYRVFPNLYCDAEVSRTAWVVPGILESLLARGRLADTVVIHLGTNGAPPDEVMEGLFDTIWNRDIYLLTVTNDADVHVNDTLRRFAEERDNIRIIGWESQSRGHEDYFYSDAIHLVDTGCQSYAQAIYQALYDRQELALSQVEESLRAELDALTESKP